MFGTLRRQRVRSSPPSRMRRAPARVESLEDRLLLYATLDAQWVHGERITWSFAPDGTSVLGEPSALFETMDAIGVSQEEWQDAFRWAAATWQEFANINLAEVPDSGDPFGISGHQQNDPRFGDIRIGAIPKSSSVLASAFPPPPILGGTLAGDIVFNSEQDWELNSQLDVATVAIHEFGHSLGLDHSEIEEAVMYAFYNGVQQSLNSDDVHGIRSIYNSRQWDPFDLPSRNNTPGDAADITSFLDADGRVMFNDLSISTNHDKDWFYVEAPPDASGSMKVLMQTSLLSSQSPRFQVYNSNLDLVAWTVANGASDAFGETIELTFTGVPAGTGVYIAAMGWNKESSGVNGIGGYGLLVDFSDNHLTGNPIPPPDTTVEEQENEGGGGGLNQTLPADDLLAAVVSDVFQTNTSEIEESPLEGQSGDEEILPPEDYNGSGVTVAMSDSGSLVRFLNIETTEALAEAGPALEIVHPNLGVGDRLASIDASLALLGAAETEGEEGVVDSRIARWQSQLDEMLNQLMA